MFQFVVAVSLFARSPGQMTCRSASNAACGVAANAEAADATNAKNATLLSIADPETQGFSMMQTRFNVRKDESGDSGYGLAPPKQALAEVASTWPKTAFMAMNNPQLHLAATALSVGLFIAVMLLACMGAVLQCCRLVQRHVASKCCGTAVCCSASGTTTHISKEALFAIGICTTAFQGGGLIFGFSAFAQKLMALPNSPVTINVISVIYAAGHVITAIGCVISGVLLDYAGPCFCAASGLVIEAVGNLMLADIANMSPMMITIAYGLLGWGGCQVFVAALTFPNAFERANLRNSFLTGAFDVGSFLFMILPYVNWESFFFASGLFCLVTAIVTSLSYPNDPLPSVSEQCDSENGANPNTIISSEYWKAMRKSFTPSMVGFMITFMVAGSALIYGIGEFPAAVKAKDDCMWDDHLQDFKECKGQAVQENLNFIGMPLANFTLPATVGIGMIIDRYGFALPGVITIASMQAFMASLWLSGLTGQYITLIFYNIAYASLFTVQNAYICSVRQEFIGGLFAISNVLLSAGNLVAMWLNTNPFAHGPTAVPLSLAVSCASQIVIMLPLYFWPGVEAKQRKAIPVAL